MIQRKDSPLWKCSTGAYAGWYDERNEVLRATGITYATSDRFGLPSAIQPTDKVIDAKRWSVACPQPPDQFTSQYIPKPTRKTEKNEHCQQLSITIPRDTTPESQLPVMIWIHGGSYVTGGGDYAMYNPAALVKEQRVIVVNVTYRLGLFGYLGEDQNKPANLGLLDQIEALRWVKNNINSFGGDAKNITLFGESAGGDSVAHLMISEGTEGLFNRAIIQSAPFGLLPKREKMSQKMNELAQSVSKNTPVGEILETQDTIQEKVKSFGLKATMPFGLQYSHYPLPKEKDLDEAWKNVASRVEILIGSNSREVASFIPLIPSAKKITALPYFGHGVGEFLVKILTHKIYTAGAKNFAKRHANGGGKGYYYKFSWGGKGNQFAAGHGTELALLFEDDTLWDDSPLLEGTTWEEVSRQAHALRGIWGSFAKTGKVTDKYIPKLIKVKELKSNT